MCGVKPTCGRKVGVSLLVGAELIVPSALLYKLIKNTPHFAATLYVTCIYIICRVGTRVLVPYMYVCK